MAPGADRKRKAAREDARKAALDLLDAVLAAGHPLDEAMTKTASFRALAPEARAFARRLAVAVIRRLGELDGLIDGFLESPLSRRKARLRNLLRLGLAQLLFLDVPPYAAITTTLELAAERRTRPYKGLIHALLARAGREGRAHLAEMDGVRRNTADWLWRALVAAYGEASARAIAEIHQQDPPLDLTLRAGSDDRRALEDWAGRLEARILPTGSLRLTRLTGGITRLAGYAEGAWWVQDAAAALPVRLFGALPGRRAIDLCAAPGGKTAQLAAGGAEVTAIDRSPARLERLRANLLRLGLEAQLVEADARRWRPAAPAELVLLDAPCSATGTLRRHPDVQHRRGVADLPLLTALQSELLAAAGEMVAPGGLLVYAVCSLLPEEGPAVVNAFLEGGAPFERLAVTPVEVAGLEELVTPLGELRSLPCHLAEAGGLDGFYVARLRRL